MTEQTATASRGRLRSVTHQPKVLVVEDDDAMRQALIAGLGEDADVAGAVDVLQAIQFIAAFQPDVVVLDLLLDPRLPSWSNGGDIPRLLRERHIQVPPLIVLSGRPGGADIARSIGAAVYYRKPIDMDALAARIKELVDVVPPAALDRDRQAAL